MTILSSAVGNVAGQPITKSVWIKAARLRQGAAAGTVVDSERFEVKPVAGVLITPELQPGPAVITWGVETYYVTIPAAGTVSWWSVLALAVGVPPGTSEAAIAEALAVYLDANPIEGGGLSVEQIAAQTQQSGSPLKSALDNTYVPLERLAKNPDLLISGAITRNSDQAVTSAAVVWPDGTAGTFTALVLSSAFPGAVDSYSITYGSPATKTYTQPTLTRNSEGAATALPAIVVS